MTYLKLLWCVQPAADTLHNTHRPGRIADPLRILKALFDGYHLLQEQRMTILIALFSYNQHNRITSPNRQTDKGFLPSPSQGLRSSRIKNVESTTFNCLEL